VKLALRLGGFVLAIALFWILLSRIGVEQVTAQLSQVGPGFIWILVLHALAIAIAALPWWLVLSRDVRPSPMAAVISRFFAQGAAAMLPLFGLGGELVRLLWLRKGTRAAGVAGIVVDRVLYGASSAVLLIVGMVGLLHVPTLPADFTHGAAIGVGGIIAVLALVAILARRGLGVRLHRLIHRMHRKVDRGDTHFGEEVDRNIEAMLKLRSRPLWLGIALHLLARAVIGLEVYIGFYLLGVTLSWDEAFVFAALPAILAVTGALVPSQLGVLEGAHALVAASFGISPTTAVAVVLLLRLRQLAGAAILGPIILLRRRGIAASASDSAAVPHPT
jgi:uncharacterized protein (TIRG00374 family)